jgi:hypothetical protein
LTNSDPWALVSVDAVADRRGFRRIHWRCLDGEQSKALLFARGHGFIYAVIQKSWVISARCSDRAFVAMAGAGFAPRLPRPTVSVGFSALGYGAGAQPAPII